MQIKRHKLLVNIEEIQWACFNIPGDKTIFDQLQQNRNDNFFKKEIFVNTPLKLEPFVHEAL